MGERSKNIGEDGEDIVLKFFKKIGWPAPVEGVDIPCQSSQKHRDAESADHGVDFIFSYLCPVQNTHRRNIVVSVKNSTKEEKRPRSKLLKDIIDLASAIQCFKVSNLRAMMLRSRSGARHADDVGILFIMNKSSRSGTGIINSIGERTRFEYPGKSSICIFENARHDFINHALNHQALFFQDWKRTFFHPRNTQTAQANHRVTHSPLLPVHSLLGGPLCLRLERTGPSGMSESALLIYSQEEFSADRLQRLVAIGMDLSSSWVNVYVAFPDYIELDDKDTVRACLGSMSDASFTQKVHCISFQLIPRTT